MEKIKRLLWKIYFSIAVLSSLFIILGLVFMQEQLIPMTNNIFTNLYNIVMMIIFFASLIGLRGYIYQKRYFTRRLWMFIFYVILVDNIGTFIYDFNSINKGDIVLWLTIVPLFYALWSYSFKMNYVWEIVDND